MFRPQIQKTSTLLVIAIFNVMMVFLAVNSETKIKNNAFDEKIAATKNMHKCIDGIKKLRNKKITKNDIFKTGLIGEHSTSITTKFDTNEENNKYKMLDSKIIVTHPNFAAFIVDLFNEAEVSQGDTIAVSMTGSFPGANIALLSVCEALDVVPVIISSVGSSSWGANVEDFTWPKVEKFLYDNKLINYKSIAYSIGGSNDNGDNLTDKGIENIEESIPDDVIFVNESTLSRNIQTKLSIFNSYSQNYSLYVNIGGGSSSLGGGAEKDTLKVGLLSYLDVEDVNSEDFKKSIAYNFLNPNTNTYSIPMINIKNIKQLLGDKYKLLLKDKHFSELYEGELFYSRNNYNINVILIGLLLSILLITSIGIYSHKQIKKRMETHEIDSII